jgi:hypothetical protein
MVQDADQRRGVELPLLRQIFDKSEAKFGALRETGVLKRGACAGQHGRRRIDGGEAPMRREARRRQDLLSSSADARNEDMGVTGMAKGG